ncbi:hypothetical protein DFH09DRAFT_1191184 [Mycena vulgaris]|nr:hypothetical protein DFH09DRAFT_1191184 [Mycena vulgaris]
MVTDAHMEAYRVAHDPNEPSLNSHLFRPYKHKKIYSVAERLGFTVEIDWAEPEIENSEDIMWVSYTKGGLVKVTEVPTASRLERFATELGITEKIQWLDAGFAAGVTACIYLPPLGSDAQFSGLLKPWRVDGHTSVRLDDVQIRRRSEATVRILRLISTARLWRQRPHLSTSPPGTFSSTHRISWSIFSQGWPLSDSHLSLSAQPSLQPIVSTGSTSSSLACPIFSPVFH